MRSWFLIFIIFPLIAFSQETITITTYYPAPYGVYKYLRLYPTPCEPADCQNANQRGTQCFDSNTNTLYVCKETSPGTYEWVASGGREITLLEPLTGIVEDFGSTTGSDCWGGWTACPPCAYNCHWETLTSGSFEVTEEGSKLYTKGLFGMGISNISATCDARIVVAGDVIWSGSCSAIESGPECERCSVNFEATSGELSIGMHTVYYQFYQCDCGRGYVSVDTYGLVKDIYEILTPQ
jgi:hypothetical protein